MGRDGLSSHEYDALFGTSEPGMPIQTSTAVPADQMYVIGGQIIASPQMWTSSATGYRMPFGTPPAEGLDRSHLDAEEWLDEELAEVMEMAG